MSNGQAEHRMLIDGKLVDASSGATFANVNPATEEVIGEVADGTLRDMDHAIGAARRAFDETTWSTDRDLRKRGLMQLHAALDKERETLRGQIVAEVGTPDPVHLRRPARHLHRRHAVGHRPASTRSSGSTTCRYTSSWA